MTQEVFILPDELYESLQKQYDKAGKNSHIGGKAVKIVESYFLSKWPGAKIKSAKQGGDLEISHESWTKCYEVKGTEGEKIAYNKLKVSSKACYKALTEGMEIIRVSHIGQKEVTLTFMKFGEDFTLEPEARWAIKPIKQKSINRL